MNCLILCNQDDRELLIKKFINRNYNQTIHFTFIKTLEDIFNIVRNRRFPVEFLLIQLIHDADFAKFAKGSNTTPQYISDADF